MIFEKFKEVVLRNIDETLLKKKKEKNKSNGSFNELIYRGISNQSLNIILGTILEKAWKEAISFSKDSFLIDIKTVSSHQIDIIFRNNDTIYYFESKNNLNLDTEKSIATFNKIKAVESGLREIYKNETIVCKILSNRYFDAESAKLYKKPINKNILIGYGEMFDILGEHVTEEEWEKFFFEEVGSKIWRG